MAIGKRRESDRRKRMGCSRPPHLQLSLRWPNAGTPERPSHLGHKLSASAVATTDTVAFCASLAFAGAVKRVTDENDNSYDNQFTHKIFLSSNQSLDITALQLSNSGDGRFGFVALPVRGGLPSVMTKATTNTACLFMSIATTSAVVAAASETFCANATSGR